MLARSAFGSPPRTLVWRSVSPTWPAVAAAVLAGSALIALSARVVIPLPFSPVPITGQTFAVLLVGAALGGRLGAIAGLAYLAEGLAGLPVFFGGRNAWTPTVVPGVPHILGPTAGYLFSYPLAMLLVGWLAERGLDRRVLTTILAMALGNAVIYLVGVTWLARFVGPDQALLQGLGPFLVGDALKLALAALALPAAWRLLGRRRQ